MSDALNILKTLSEAIGPSGREHDVIELVVDMVKGYADEVRVDALGNVIATRHGARKEKLLLAAHTDEVGFLIALVEPSGMLRIAPLGSWDPRVLYSQAVTIKTRAGVKLRGVIGSTPPHVLRPEEASRVLPVEDLFVDVGASSAEEVARMGIAPGDACVPGYNFERVADDLVMGKAFDNRAGCTVGIMTLRNLAGQDLDLTTIVAFATQEEVGHRGATPLANETRADVGLALEGTTAVDIPGVKPIRQACAMGKGPAVTIADNSLIADLDVNDKLSEVARDENIPFQFKVPIYGGGTDAKVIQAAGTKVSVVSIPCRYIHTPNTLLRPSDLEGWIKLVTAFANRAGELV